GAALSLGNAALIRIVFPHECPSSQPGLAPDTGSPGRGEGGLGATRGRGQRTRQPRVARDSGRGSAETAAARSASHIGVIRCHRTRAQAAGPEERIVAARGEAGGRRGGGEPPWAPPQRTAP